MPDATQTAENVGEAVQRLKKSDGRVAVFLGAGAAVLFGYPLTRDLLGGIIRNLADAKGTFLDTLIGDEANAGERNRQELEAHLKGLLPGGIFDRKNLPLVTSLLSLLDYSLATGQSILPSRSATQIRQARSLLERAILEVIADNERFTKESEQALDDFAGLLADLRGPNSQTINVITTNYDMASDEAVGRAAGVAALSDDFWNDEDMGRKVDFGFSWVHPDPRDPPLVFERPANPAARLLKLHGSTNWLKCPLCDNVYINMHGPIWDHAYRGITDVSNSCHCSLTRLEAQIVSPSFVREMREPNLLAVWKGALDVLRQADEWLIVGYSFPDEDLGVRALFTRAYGSRKNRPHITVVQWDRDALPRYEAFFEPTGLTYCTGGLKALLDGWRGPHS